MVLAWHVAMHLVIHRASIAFALTVAMYFVIKAPQWCLFGL